MSFFESLLVLLAVAIALLQVSRRLGIPFPAMLAAAGVGLGLIPGVPQIALEPRTALALFIAPALVDAAFDFPVGQVWRLWRPLFALVVVAVALSAGLVTWLGVELAGLPVYAALALGAIVAPPDAVAATATLSAVSMPRRSIAVLKGESLLNDSLALLLFTAATSVPAHGGMDRYITLQLVVAAPGGILLGIVCAKLLRLLVPYVTGTLGGNLLEFVNSIGVWIIADRLGLSPVLCLVAFAMTIARSASLSTRPRMRIHSFAVWETAVFLLNVLAFLIMGLQARTIVGAMSAERLAQAGRFAGTVIVSLILVRLVWVLIYNRLAHYFSFVRGDFKPASLRHGLLIAWCGMRGLMTVATAFALPESFPQRDLIVLTAFSVVLATLVVQGLTLVPLVKLLKLDGEDGLADEMAWARAEMARAALASLEGRSGGAVDHWRYSLRALSQDDHAIEEPAALRAKRETGLAVMRAQRQRLEELRNEQRVGADAFLMLQEDLDFHEVAVSSEADRRIEES